jgi:hypothetical protein
MHKMPETKLSKLLKLMAAADWPAALRLAASFPDLGGHKAAIKRGHEAHWHPAWARQLGRNPAEDIAAGVAALRELYERRGPPSL